MANKEIIIGVTGGIAAYKVGDIISQLKKNNFNVTVVMTQEAQKFVTPLTFAVLSQNKVYAKLFEKQDNWDVKHVDLAKKAKVILVAPATANIIAKVACGIADDLLSCIILDTNAKVVFAPAMNERMYKNPMTQDNISRLVKAGYKFVGPKKGRLACGEEGLGCMADINDIVKEVKRLAR